jgi:hypothetical protein
MLMPANCTRPPLPPPLPACRLDHLRGRRLQALLPLQNINLTLLTSRTVRCCVRTLIPARHSTAHHLPATGSPDPSSITRSCWPVYTPSRCKTTHLLAAEPEPGVRQRGWHAARCVVAAHAAAAHQPVLQRRGRHAARLVERPHPAVGAHPGLELVRGHHPARGVCACVRRHAAQCCCRLGTGAPGSPAGRTACAASHTRHVLPGLLMSRPTCAWLHQRHLAACVCATGSHVTDVGHPLLPL